LTEAVKKSEVKSPGY